MLVSLSADGTPVCSGHVRYIPYLSNAVSQQARPKVHFFEEITIWPHSSLRESAQRGEKNGGPGNKRIIILKEDVDS